MKTGIEIHVVLDGPVPVYRQIADAVRAHCVAGRIEPGMKLPAVRELAAALGVHFNTVAEAYRTLAEEGWVHIEGRRGALVKYRDQPGPPNPEVQAREGSRVRHLVAELLAKGFSRELILKEVEAGLG